MKKITLIIAVCIISISLNTTVFAAGERDRVPSVEYLLPDNDSIIDLTGKNSLTFGWKSNPIPNGGRDSYRFKLLKGFGYNFIMSEEIDRDIFSIQVPADKFEDGQTYSWYVQQRDTSLGIWSRFTAWSFKVIKNKEN